MNMIKVAVMIITTTTMLMSCSTPAYVEKDDNVNLSNYKTYMWVDVKANENDASSRSTSFADLSVHNSVNAQLNNWGWQEVTDNPDVAEIINRISELDNEIQIVAPERPLTDINKVDLAVLRLIVFEWKTSHTPKKVLIDEGVELAKEFGTDSSPKFVNGVLAKLLTGNDVPAGD